LYLTTLLKNLTIMKKTISIFALGLLLMGVVQTANAQYQKGDKELKVGVGVFGLGINGTAQYTIMDDLSVGLYVGYERLTVNYLISKFSYNSITIGPVATYQLNNLLKMGDNKFGVYATGGFILNTYSYSDDYWIAYGGTNKKSYTDPQALLRLGSTYNFSENLKLFADAGYGGSWIQGGVCLKF
jgi:hypothetical protein